MTKSRLLSGAIVVLGALAAHGNARADPVGGAIQGTLNNPTGSMVSLSNISLDGGQTFELAYTGALQVNVTSSTISGVAAGPVNVFCIDPRTAAFVGSPYSYGVGNLQDGDASIGGMGQVKADALRELYGRYVPASGVMTVDQAAALQLATWKIVADDTGSRSLGTGTFIATPSYSIAGLNSITPAAIGLADQELASLDGSGPKLPGLYGLISGSSSQDFLFAPGSNALAYVGASASPPGLPPADVPPLNDPPATLFTKEDKELAHEFGEKLEVAHAALSIASIGMTFAEGLHTLKNVASLALETYEFFSSLPSTRSVIADRIGTIVGLGLGGVGLAIACTPEAETGIAAAACAAAELSLALDIEQGIMTEIHDDPLDPLFHDVFLPTIEPSTVPLDATYSDAGTAGLAASYAVNQTLNWLAAINVTNNRYQGALAAGDLTSAAIQAAVFSNYLAAYNKSLTLETADLNQYRSLLASEGLGLDLPTAGDFSELATDVSGLSFEQLRSYLGPLGLSDNDIAALLEGANSPTFEPPAGNLFESLDDLTRSPPSFKSALSGGDVVPEPSVWTLMLAGFGGLGAVLRSRRRLAAIVGS